MNEKQLIQEAQQGNQSAFETLIKSYDDRIMALIMSFVRNRNDAQDVYQEVFLRVWMNLPRFRSESSFFTWLYRIAVNRCISLCEQRGRRDRMHVQPRESSEEDGDWLDRVAVASDDREKREKESRLKKIWEQCDELNPRQQMVINLRFRHGLKLKEIAEILEIPEGTVKILTFRAVRKIRQQLEEAAS